MTLEEKIKECNKNIDELLNTSVEIKVISIVNNKVLLDSNKLLPSFNINKGSITNENILSNINTLLEINITEIKDIPYFIYNDYSKRYYIIKIDMDSILNINSNYSFYNIEDMSSDIERDIISK